LDPNVDEREEAWRATAELVGVNALARLRDEGRAARLTSLLDDATGDPAPAEAPAAWQDRPGTGPAQGR
jgi:hypothetical protein